MVGYYPQESAKILEEWKNGNETGRTRAAKFLLTRERVSDIIKSKFF